MIPCILAHDLGTSGNKASLFGTDGRLVDSAVVSYSPIYPKRGWAEEDAGQWWYAVCEATKAVLKRNPEVSVEAVAVSGQMMGCLPLDRNGNPLGNSLIWSDARAEAECERITGRVTRERYNRITGQPPSASYSLPKILWQKEHTPEIYEKAYKYVQAKDFINFMLTGRIVTDPTDAAYTIAYDIAEQDWSGEILECAGIPKSLFPEVVPCETIVGKVTKEASLSCGIPEGTPVAAGAGDGSAAHLGAACVEPGDSYLCLGSSTWLVTQTDRLILDGGGRLQSEPHVIPKQYVYLGTMQTGGLAHSWAKHHLSSPPLSYSEIEDMVSESGPGAGGILFLPYLMGERSPWYDLRARGAFLGIHQETSQGDFYRAVMEGVAFNLKLLLNVIEQDTKVEEIVLIGGGGKSRGWRQILSDVFQKKICLPANVEEGTSIGGALIAGVGVGIFPDYSVAKEFMTIEETVDPSPETGAYYEEMGRIFEDSYHSLKEISHRLSTLPDVWQGQT
ncbi:MAG: xylulokinase [Lachnospiraceae bacterium]|jgi:xylulokinase|nr:xylulokinase [Lachnospiraceae bacterium]